MVASPPSLLYRTPTPFPAFICNCIHRQKAKNRLASLQSHHTPNVVVVVVGPWDFCSVVYNYAKGPLITKVHLTVLLQVRRWCLLWSDQQKHTTPPLLHSLELLVLGVCWVCVRVRALSSCGVVQSKVGSYVVFPLSLTFLWVLQWYRFHPIGQRGFLVCVSARAAFLVH